MKLNATIIALPLAILALGIIIVPFVVWDTNDAARFSGSFVAAIVSAIAAFSGYFIQHKLTLEREDRAEKSKLGSDFIGLYFWLRNIGTILQYAEGVLERQLKAPNKRPDDHTPFYKLTFVELRTLEFSDIVTDTKNHAATALRLPNHLGFAIAEKLHEICELSADLKTANEKSPDHKLSFNNVTGIKNIIHKRRTRLVELANDLEAHLKETGDMPN